jgi:hypothetical protein
LARTLELAWDGGFIIVRGNDTLEVVAENTTIGFSEREVTVDGLFAGIREHPLDRRNQRKIVYIILAFPMKPLSGMPKSLVMSNIDASVGRFGVSYTVIDGVQRYITIYAPPSFLYEHAVVSSDRIAITTLGRRQVYVMDEGRLKRIILV